MVYIVRGLRILSGMCFCVVYIHFCFKSCLYDVALLCVVCLFVRKANGRGKRFYDRELPLPTSACCVFDCDVATDVFLR